MDPTTDKALRSWLPVAADSHFPIQNLPYGAFRRGGAAHVGVAIGREVLDLTVLEAEGFLAGAGQEALGLFSRGDLAAFLEGGPAVWRGVRQAVSRLWRADEPALRDNARVRELALLAQADVVMGLPAPVGDYTDFYSSKEHATNVGAMFRDPQNALLPNWLHLPVAYHGRSASV